MPTTVEQAIELATHEVFAVLIGCDAVSKLHGGAAGRAEALRLVSSLPLGGSVRGAAHLLYTLPMATRIACRLLEAEPPVAREATVDAMCEVANMIVGSVKSCLENQWGSIRIGTPRMGVLADLCTDLPPMTVDFHWNGEPFTVSFAFQATEDDCKHDSAIDRPDHEVAGQEGGPASSGRGFGTPYGV